MNQHPRVLFVTPHAFNRVTGGGITFSSLFRGWPADRLATAHSDPEPTSDDVCRLYFRLGPAQIDYVWPISCLRRAGPGQNEGGSLAKSPAGAGTAGTDPLGRETCREKDCYHVSLSAVAVA